MALTRLNNRSLSSDSQFTADQLNIGQIGGRRNLLINGNMEVNQRGTTSFTSTGQSWTVDRWIAAKNDTVNYDASVNDFALGQTDVPQGQKYISRTLNSAGSAVDFITLEQRLESDILEITSGQKVTISFWARASQNHTFDADNLAGLANPQHVVDFMQYFGTGGSSLVATPFATSIDLTTTWTKYTYTIDVPSIAGKTLGTNPMVRIYIITMADDDVGITVDIAQVQLELGSVATPFEHRSYGEELALCQRYFERIGGDSYAPIGSGMQRTTSQTYATIDFKVTKRANPTQSFNNIITTDRYVFDQAITGVEEYKPSLFGAQIRFGHSAVGAERRPVIVCAPSVGTGYIDFDAEL